MEARFPAIPIEPAASDWSSAHLHKIATEAHMIVRLGGDVDVACGHGPVVRFDLVFLLDQLLLLSGRDNGIPKCRMSR